MQLRRSLELFVRSHNTGSHRCVRPLQLEVPAALGEPDVLRQGNIHDAVLEGDVGMGNRDADLAVLGIGHKVPVAASGKQGIIRHRDEQMAGALGVNDLGGHGGEVHTGHVVVAAGQEDVGEALAQLVALGELTVGVPLVDADGDALIGGLRAGLGLEVEGLGLALAHLQLAVENGKGVGGFIVLPCDLPTRIAQRAQIAAASHRQDEVVQVLGILPGDVGKVHRHGKVGAAHGAGLLHKIGLVAVQRQADRGRQVDGHAVAGGGGVVGIDAVESA